MWPFRSKPVAQASGGLSATEVAVEALQREAAGLTPDAAALATAEACIGLWSRAMASATVQPASMALAGLTAPALALAGRMLAMRGNAVFLIAVERGRVMLHPAAGWDPRGGYMPDSRRYRLTMSGPDGTRTVNAPGDSVLHFAYGATEAEWWRGRGPLWRSRATAGLAAAIEAQATKEAKIPPVRFAQGDFVGMDGKDKADLRDSIRQGGLITFPKRATNTHPADRQFSQTASIGPDPKPAFVDLRKDAGREVLSAFGLSAALFDSSSDGSARRESWRQAWIATFAPLGKLLEAEIRAKLDPMASVRFEALRASDEDGRSRAISRRADAFKKFLDAGIEREEALRLAGIGEME